MGNGIFNTAKNLVIDNIAGNANNKNITQPLVEDIDRRYPTVSTGKDNRYRILAGNQATPGFFTMVGMFKFSANKAFVAVEKSLQGILSCQLDF